MHRTAIRFGVPLFLLLAAAGSLHAQIKTLTLPPPGDNQRSVTTQYMGQVAVTIDYNSPDVHAPNGDDRTGKIWGQLVPWGMVNLGFGTATESPWRAGANENTTITFSHDVHVEGQPLAAGTYGLHMIPGEQEWQVVFSNQSKAWGSFFYDPAEDALRVTVTPREAAFREWLTYDFLDRQWDSTEVALHWENLQVPFRVSVPDPVGLYVETLKNELDGQPGFNWQNWNAAANFILQRDSEGEYLDLAATWADTAVGPAFPGQANFTTLSTKSQILARQGKTEEAMETMDQAVEHPTTTPFQIHAYGRQLIAQGQAEKAMEIFQLNYDRNDGAWPTEVGMMRGLSALGKYDEALEHARKAHEQAPDELNKNNLAGAIEALEKGEGIN